MTIAYAKAPRSGPNAGAVARLFVFRSLDLLARLQLRGRFTGDQNRSYTMSGHYCKGTGAAGPSEIGGSRAFAPGPDVRRSDRPRYCKPSAKMLACLSWQASFGPVLPGCSLLVVSLRVNQAVTELSRLGESTLLPEGQNHTGGRQRPCWFLRRTAPRGTVSAKPPHARQRAAAPTGRTSPRRQARFPWLQVLPPATPGGTQPPAVGSPASEQRILGSAAPRLADQVLPRPSTGEGAEHSAPPARACCCPGIRIHERPRRGAGRTVRVHCGHCCCG